MSKKELFRSVEAPADLALDRGTAVKPCFLCGGRTATRLYMQAHFPIVRCSGCRLVYADEHFRAEDLASFYTGDYYQRAYVCHPKEIDQKIARDYVRAFDRVDREIGRGRLLDFGSARGSFLGELRRAGYGDRWRFEGVDINPDEVRMGEAEQLPVRCVALEDAGYEDGSFDAVTAFSVIEHLQDPAAILKSIARILRPGGEVLIIVPHGECLIIKLAVLASRIAGNRVRAFTDNVFHEEHLYYFGRRTLDRALRDAGFTARQWFFEPSYLETHPPGSMVAIGAYALRFASWLFRQQTMLGVVATKSPCGGGGLKD